MIGVEIKHIRKFMSLLLTRDTFDRFLVSDVSITTFTTFRIDGQLRPDFFEPETADALKQSLRTHVLWREIRPFCLSIIRGQRTPSSFHIVFQMPSDLTASLIRKSGAAIREEDVDGLFLNCQFRNNILTLTTGTSLKIFTMDKTLSRAWDRTVTEFLQRMDL